MRLGELLVSAGAITPEQRDEALDHQARHQGKLGSTLVELGFIDGNTLAKFLSQQLRIPAASAASIDRVSPKAVARIPAQVAERLRAVPVREDAGRLFVALADPTDREAVAELQRLVGGEVRVMVAPDVLIQYALEKHYRVRRRRHALEVKDVQSDELLRDIPIAAPPPPSKAVPVARAVPPPMPHEPGGPPAIEAPLWQPIPIGVDRMVAETGYLDEAPAGPAAQSSPIAMAPLTVAELGQKLAGITTDDAALELAVRFLHQHCACVWIFLVRKGELHSWSGRGAQAGALGALTPALDELPLVERALSTGEVLAGTLHPNALGKLAAPLGLTSETLGLIIPIRVARRPVGVLFGLEASLDVMRRKGDIDKLGEKLDHALHINQLRRLLSQP